ncbi:MAG: DNA polymerase, partial [Myxococcaceae bacterium]
FPDLMPLIFEAYERQAIGDTGIREKLIDIAHGNEQSSYSLASLASRYLGLELDKDTWRLRYGDFKETALENWPQGAKEYARTDARITLEVYYEQERHHGRDICLFADEVAQCRADFALRLASNHGMITDPKTVQKFAQQILVEFEQIQKLLFEQGLLRKDRRGFVRNNKKAQERLEDILGRDAKRTPSGKIQLDDEACFSSIDPLLQIYNRYGKLQVLISKDLEILKRGTREPIHTYFNVLVNTGRTSSRNPNLQNPRREPGIRECYVPRGGFVFASADYEAAELHTLAQVCLHFFKYSSLANQLNAGIDPHLSFGASLLGVPYEEAVTRRRNDDTRILEMRQMAKAANFGFPGGMGPNTFMAYAKGYGVDLDLEQATELRNKWLDSFPEMREYFHFINGLIGRGSPGNITHLHTYRRRGNVTYTAACNSFFQGLAADGAKRALFEVQWQCHAKPESPLYGSRVVNFLHDEIILEVPEDRGHEAATQLAQVMVREFNHFVQDVPVRASPQLMRCWSKNAKVVYDAQGRLVPWQP